MDALLLTRLVVEVRYADAYVYLDRCGSTTDHLVKMLGKGFHGSVPQMTEAQITSQVERATVSFSWRRFVVQQQWVSTPIRVVDIAERSWRVLEDRLGVRNKVERLGFRAFFNYAVDDEDAVQRAVERCSFVSLGRGDLADMALPPRTMSMTFGRKEGQLFARLALEKVAGGEPNPIVDELYWKYNPRHAMQLDVDVWQDVTDGQLVDSKVLRRYMDESWEWMTQIRNSFGRKLAL